jgi:hypothetical protein
MGPQKWGALQKLCEDYGDMAAAPVMDAPADDMDGASEEDLESALTAALAPFIQEAFKSGDPDKLCAACRDFVKLHAKHTGKGGDSGGDKEKPAPEAESKKPSLAAVLAECSEKGWADPPSAHLAILTEIADPATRTAYVLVHAKQTQAGTRPTGVSRRPGAGTAGTVKPLAEQTTAPAAPKIPKFDEI